MTHWVGAGEVRQYALVKWDSLNYDISNKIFATESDFDDFLEAYLIPRAQGHINAYCRRDFDTDYPSAIPDAIKDVCARAASNMIQYLVMNRTGPLIKISDYKVSMPEQAVLPDDLKKLLEPWVKRGPPYIKASSYKNSYIQDTWDE